MSDTQTLVFQTRSDELQRIMDAVQAISDAEQWAVDVFFKVQMVLEELSLNIINYGYDEGVHSFEIQITSDPEQITIEISDGGRPFNPLEDSKQPVTDAAMEDRPVGGLGVYLVREMTDAMEYRREGGRNHSTMVIRNSR